MKKIKNDPKNPEEFLDRPLMRIGFGYYENSELTPTHLDIGYLKKGVNNSLWLLDSISLIRIFDLPQAELPIHNIIGDEYQLRKDLCQLILTYNPKQEHLYEFESDSDAESIFRRLREGSKAVVIK